MKIEFDQLNFHPQSDTNTFPFLYYISSEIKENRQNLIHLILHGSNIPDYENGGYVSTTFDEQIVEHTTRITEKIFPHLSKDFIYIFIIRPRKCDSDRYPAFLYDCQAFTKEVMTEEYINQNEENLYTRPDLKILETMKLFKKKLSDNSINHQKKYCITGGSAGALAANRFTFLHPQEILSLSMWSCGVFQYPLKEINGILLEYPFGTNNLEYPKNLIKQLSHISINIFAGTNDKSDPLEYELYDNRELVKPLKKVMGKNPFSRAEKYVDFLKENKIEVCFKIYDELEHFLPLDDVFLQIENGFSLYR